MALRPPAVLSERDVLKKSIAELEALLTEKKKYLKTLEGKGALPGAPAAGAGEKEEVKRDWRFDLLLSVGEECQTEEELAFLLSKKANPRCYDGFEPSGRMHIAQGIFKTINVNKCTKAGCTFIFWVADWFALMNDKMGGSLPRIRTVGEYLIEVWKAAGMDLANVQFIWSSDEINKHAEGYWLQMLDVARVFNIPRITKCCQIMGRQEGTLTTAQILYPLMQCTDIFFLQADICQLGVDQKKVNMLAIDYCNVVGRKVRPHKPVILSHHMMFGLGAGQAKMSKSDSGSAIFMEDSQEDVEKKIANAWCPTDAENIDKNPCLDYLRYLIFSNGEEFMGFTDADSLKEALASGKLDQQAMKKELAAAINKKLQRVRDHFATDEKAKKVLEMVKKFKEEVEMEKKQGIVHSDKKESPIDEGSVCVPIFPSAQGVLLNQVLTTAGNAKEAIKAGKKVKLLLLDWTGYVLNVADRDMKSIHAVLTVTAGWIKAFLRAAGAGEVEVQLQSSAILADPDSYWVSVINRARGMLLDDFSTTLGMADREQPVGPIIAGLMLLQDLAVAGCGTVALPPAFHAMAVKYLSGIKAVMWEPLVPCLREGHTDALPGSDGRLADPINFSKTIFMDDQPMIFNGKVKQAFCPPEVVDGNPIITMAAGITRFLDIPFNVTRPEQYGGDASFTPDELPAAYKENKLHPGDLKPAVQKLLADLLAKARSSLSGDEEFAKAEKQVKTFVAKTRPKK